MSYYILSQLITLFEGVSAYIIVRIILYNPIIRTSCLSKMTIKIIKNIYLSARRIMLIVPSFKSKVTGVFQEVNLCMKHCLTVAMTK